MKRIDNTEVWSDGGVKYTKNASGDFEIYIEPTVEQKKTVKTTGHIPKMTL